SPQLQEQRNQVIRDAISYVQALPYVDQTRVGAFGLSLGGFHVMDLAGSDGRLAAVVNVVGAMPNTEMRRGVREMPPTLILHGDKDRVVPVA
ncbi:dienelactone hydrolase family protein, partial [Acinetobacter baumannii]